MLIAKPYLPIVVILFGAIALSGCSPKMTPLRMEEDCLTGYCGVMGLDPGAKVRVVLRSGDALEGTVEDCSCESLTVVQLGNYGRVEKEVRLKDISRISRVGEGSLSTILLGSIVVLGVSLYYAVSHIPD